MNASGVFVWAGASASVLALVLLRGRGDSQILADIKKLAEESQKLAEESKKLAEESKKLAEKSLDKVEKLADESKKLADESKKLAEESKKLAKKSLDKVEKLADESKKLAEKSLDEVEKLADESKKVADEVEKSMGRVVDTLSLLWKQQFHPTRPSSTASNKFKETVIKAYKLESNSYLPCFVTGLVFDSEKVKTAHIYQRRWPPTILDEMGIDINSASNLLLMLSKVEIAFDRFHLVIIPIDDDTFVTHVLYPDLKEKMIQSHAERSTSMLWKQLNNKPLTFPSGFRPAKRLCAFHAKVAINYAVEHGWITEEAAPVVPEEAFGSPGFDKELMQ